MSTEPAAKVYRGGGKVYVFARELYRWVMQEEPVVNSEILVSSSGCVGSDPAHARDVYSPSALESLRPGSDDPKFQC